MSATIGELTAPKEKIPTPTNVTNENSEIIKLTPLPLPTTNESPLRMISTGQNLQIYVHTVQSTTPVVLSKNIIPTNIRKNDLTNLPGSSFFLLTNTGSKG